jgi:hypothetical protein
MTAPIRLYMTMSLDGFIAGPDDREGQELGRGGGRLFNWLDDRMSDGPSGQVFREAMATGAVITTTACRSSSSPIASTRETFRQAARGSSRTSRTVPSRHGPQRATVP